MEILPFLKVLFSSFVFFICFIPILLFLIFFIFNFPSINYKFIEPQNIKNFDPVLKEENFHYSKLINEDFRNKNINFYDNLYLHSCYYCKSIRNRFLKKINEESNHYKEIIKKVLKGKFCYDIKTEKNLQPAFFFFQSCFNFEIKKKKQKKFKKILDFLPKKKDKKKEKYCLTLTNFFFFKLFCSNFYEFKPELLKNVKIGEKIAGRIKENFIKLVNVIDLPDKKNNILHIKSEKERKKLLIFLKKLKIEIGKCDQKDFEKINSKIKMKENDFLENLSNVFNFFLEDKYDFFNLSIINTFKTDKKFKPEKHFLDANSWYIQEEKKVVIPIAMIQSPMINRKYNITSLYSIFGIMIAHEIAHSTENLLFKKKDKQIKEKKDLIKNFFENRADNISLFISYISWYTNFFEETGRNPNFEEKKFFFISFAQFWCIDPSKMNFFHDNVHSSPLIRVNLPFEEIKKKGLIKKKKKRY